MKKYIYQNIYQIYQFNYYVFEYFFLLALPDGSLAFSKVRSFLRKNDSVNMMYMSVKTSCNKTISLSGNHLIYARKIYLLMNLNLCKFHC